MQKTLTMNNPIAGKYLKTLNEINNLVKFTAHQRYVTDRLLDQSRDTCHVTDESSSAK